MSYSQIRSSVSPVSIEAALWARVRERVEEALESPFVAVTPRQRLCVVLLPLGMVLATLVGLLLLPQDKSPWLLPALTIYLLLLSLPFLFYQRSFGWFHPLVFTAFTEIVALVRRLGMYIYGLTSHTGLPTLDAARLNELAALELGLLALGFLCYFIGFHITRSSGFPQVPLPKPARMEMTTVCFVGFSMTAFVAYMLTKGGLNAHINDFSHRSVTMDGEGFWSPFTHAGAVACLYWLACERTALRSPLFWMCTIPSLCVNFLTTGGRSHIIYFLIFGVMIVTLRARKIFVPQMVAMALVGLMILGVLGNFRRSTEKGAADFSTVTHFNPFGAATGDATSEIARRTSSTNPAIAILERVPRDVPFLFGSSYVSLITFPIPKALWPDKPQGIHSLAGETFFGVQAGMPLGMMAESYWNFHIPGIIGAFLLLGLFHRKLMLFYLSNSDRPPAVVLYLILLCFLQGDTGVVPNLINVMLPLIVLIPISALAKRGKAASQAPIVTGERGYIS